MRGHVLFCVVATCSLLLCCNCVSCKKRCKSIPNINSEKLLKIQVDDSVRHMLGDSIVQILFEADTIHLYSLSVKASTDSLKDDSTQADSIPAPNFHGCYIKHDYGVLSKAEIYPISHILSDRDNYLPDGIRVLSPFIPRVALTFKKETAKVDVIFSFSGGQMYIIMANDDNLYFKYTYERLILKFFQNYLQDERIAEYLIL